MLFKLLLGPLFFYITLHNCNINYEIEGEKFNMEVKSTILIMIKDL